MAMLPSFMKWPSDVSASFLALFMAGPSLLVLKT